MQFNMLLTYFPSIFSWHTTSIKPAAPPISGLELVESFIGVIWFLSHSCVLVRSRPRWPCRCPTSLLQDRLQSSNLHIHPSLYPTATHQWKWTLWPVKNLPLILLASATYNICECMPSMSLSEQWFLWIRWGRRTRRAWSCWSRQRIRVPTTATPWSLLEIRGPQATSPQQPRYQSAHLHPTTLMVDWRRGGEEPAVSPRSCPTNHKTYRCPSAPGVVEIK